MFSTVSEVMPGSTSEQELSVNISDISRSACVRKNSSSAIPASTPVELSRPFAVLTFRVMLLTCEMPCSPKRMVSCVSFMPKLWLVRKVSVPVPVV